MCVCIYIYIYIFSGGTAAWQQKRRSGVFSSSSSTRPTPVDVIPPRVGNAPKSSNHCKRDELPVHNSSKNTEEKRVLSPRSH